MKPPIGGKFVAYGGPSEQFSIELFCRVVALEGRTTLYVVPDGNYEYLVTEGNRRYPRPGDFGYDWYRDNIEAASAGGLPILKCETYLVGGRPDGDGGVGRMPTVIDQGVARKIRVNDYIWMSGLSVVDCAHSMYWIYFEEPFTYMRGFYKAAFPHAEIHPYNWGNVRLLSSLPAADFTTRVHTAFAPVPTQVYSSTYLYNKVMGVAGHFVDDAIDTRRTIRFRMLAQDAPGPDYEPAVVIDNIKSWGNGFFVGTTAEPGADGAVEVTVTVEGNDLINPFVHQASYTATWRLAERTSVPDVTELHLDRARQVVVAADLNPEVRGYSGPNAYVAQQEPVAGTQVRKNTTVRLECRKGPIPGRLTSVPNVEGLSRQSAAKVIGDADLIATFAGTGRLVVTQVPEGGTQVTSGTKVTCRLGRES